MGAERDTQKSLARTPCDLPELLERHGTARGDFRYLERLRQTALFGLEVFFM